MFVFNVSVIIAVYNAEKFITQAVESALAQPETAEVVLVEDGSTDHSLEVCQALAQKHEKVHLYQHPGGVNNGAPASFNLGMQKSTCEFLAILGADDFFLPGRFNSAKEIFLKVSECDGVYEAIGIHFDNADARSAWLLSNMKHVDMTTMTQRVKPEDLFETLIKGSVGYFSLNGLVFKRSLISSTGYMNEDLLLHQDTDFSLRLAAVATLLPGRLDEPVAVRRVHDRNRISAPRSPMRVYKDRMKMWSATYRWCKLNVEPDKTRLVLNKLISYAVKYRPIRPFSLYRFPAYIRKISRLFLLAFDCPSIVLESTYWNRFASVR